MLFFENFMRIQVVRQHNLLHAAAVAFVNKTRRVSTLTIESQVTFNSFFTAARL